MEGGKLLSDEKKAFGTQLSEQIILNTELSSEAILAYTAIRIRYPFAKDEIAISPNGLYRIMFDDDVKSKKVKEKISKGINELGLNGILDVVEHKRASQFWVVNPASLYVEKGEFYVYINDSEKQRIVEYFGKDAGSMVFDVIRFYMILLTTLTKGKDKRNVGYRSIRSLADISGYNKNTVEKYISILEDAKLIYVYRADDLYLDNDNKINGISNTIGRYEDKEDVIAAGKEHQNNVSSNKTTIKISNNSGHNKSMSMIYFHFYGGKEYPEEILRECYFTTLEQNEKYRTIEQLGKGDRVKPLDKFEGYDFYGETRESYAALQDALCTESELSLEQAKHEQEGFELHNEMLSNAFPEIFGEPDDESTVDAADIDVDGSSNDTYIWGTPKSDYVSVLDENFDDEDESESVGEPPDISADDSIVDGLNYMEEIENRREDDTNYFKHICEYLKKNEYGSELEPKYMHILLDRVRKFFNCEYFDFGKDREKIDDFYMWKAVQFRDYWVCEWEDDFEAQLLGQQDISMDKVNYLMSYWEDMLNKQINQKGA